MINKIKKNKIKILYFILCISFILLITLLIKDGILFKTKGSIADLKKEDVIEDKNGYLWDNHFYACILNTYNKNNNTNYKMTDTLSDEELYSINYLDCTSNVIDTQNGGSYYSYINSDYNNYFNYKKEYLLRKKDPFNKYKYNEENYNIKDVEGIGRLQNLEVIKLDLNSYVTSGIDFSNNTNLKSISLVNSYKLDNIIGLEQLENLETLEINQVKLKDGKINDIGKINDVTTNEIFNVKTLKELTLITSADYDYKLLNNLPDLNKVYLSLNKLNLSDLSIKDKLKDLKLFKTSLFGNLNEFTSLNKLSLYDCKTDDINLSNLTNLYELELLNTSLKEDIKSLNLQNKIRYILNVNSISSNGLGNLNLKTYVTDSVLNGISNKNLKYLMSDVDDFSNYPNLDEYIGTLPSNSKSKINLKKLYTESNLDNLDKIINLDKLNVLYTKTINNNILNKLVNLNTLIIDDDSLKLDVSNNKNLMTLYTNSCTSTTSVLDKVNDLMTCDNEFDILKYPNVSELSLKTNKNKITIDSNSVIYLKVDNENLNEVYLSKIPNLTYLDINAKKLNKINLTQNKNLQYFNTKDDSFKEFMILSNTVDNKVSPIYLPDNYKITNIKVNSNIIKLESGFIKTGDTGKENIEVTYDSMSVNGNNINNKLKLKGILNIVSLEFKSLDFDDKKEYIYVSDYSDKNIIDDVKNNKYFSLKIDNNNLVVLSNDVEIFRYNIIRKPKSNKYKITDDKIIYDGSFDVNQIDFNNAVYEYNNDTLKLIYKAYVVKTFKLVKKD